MAARIESGWTGRISAGFGLRFVFAAPPLLARGLALAAAVFFGAAFEDEERFAEVDFVGMPIF